MKIVDLQTFLSLPCGTVFMKYEPCSFDELCVKGANVGDLDFTYAPLTAQVVSDSTKEYVDKLMAAQATGESVDLETDYYGRDGCFDDSQLFAVYEAKDVEGLIKALQGCLNSY